MWARIQLLNRLQRGCSRDVHKQEIITHLILRLLTGTFIKSTGNGVWWEWF